LKTSTNGVQVMHYFEQCRLKAYPDPGSADGRPWTIGWGDTGPDVVEGVEITQDDADARFERRLSREFEPGVMSLVKVPLTQGQFDALVCFAYNVGLDIDTDTQAEGLGDSTLLRKVNAGEFDGAAAEFAKWNKNDGKVMRGLIRRRAAEKALFEGMNGDQAIAVGVAAA
jgi:lysozyme